MKKPRGREILLLVLPVLVLAVFGFFLSRRGIIVTENDFVGGDGGPMIVLQANTISQWQGAGNWDNSLMNGGKVETDYDVICQSQNRGHAIRRYHRDMLVLDDSEWGAYLFVLPSGATAIVQRFGTDISINTIMNRVAYLRPSYSFSMDVQDTSLRLMVGAEAGSRASYGHKDVSITPGKKRCDVFSSPDELVIIINSQPISASG